MATIKELIPNLLLQVSIQELHNRTMITPEEGVLKYARDVDSNIIISDSTLKIFCHPRTKI